MKKIIALLFFISLFLLIIGCEFNDPNQVIDDNGTIEDNNPIVEDKYYIVTFNGNGGILVSGTEIQQIKDPSEIIVPIYEREGYLFIGFDQEISSLNDELTIYALWEKIIIDDPEPTKSYTVSFDACGGTLVEGKELQTVTSIDEIVYPTYEYRGYYVLDFEMTIDEKTNHIFVKPIYERLADYYFLKIYLDDELIKDELYRQNETIDFTMPEMEHFYIVADSEIPKTMPSQDLVINLHWQIEKCKLTINYHADQVESREYEYDYGTVLEERNLEKINILTKKGYDLVGWDTAFPIVLEEDKSINLVWEIHQYTLIFDGNGADYLEFEQLVVDYGDTLSLPNASKESFKLDGWYYNSIELKDGIWNYEYNDRTLNIKAKWLFNEDYIEFGRYPQSHVSDDALISELNKLTTTNEFGYYEYGSEEYVKLNAKPVVENSLYYKDGTVAKNGEEWFKVEPIKWSVKGNDNYLLSPLNLLDVMFFDLNNNPYSKSYLRSFLNNTFKNRAFNDVELARLLNISATNVEFVVDGNKVTQYVAAFHDQVMIKSVTSEIVRTLELTDYALARGASVTTATTQNGDKYYYGNWWVMEQTRYSTLSYYQLCYNYYNDEYERMTGNRDGVCIYFSIALDM